MMMTLRTAAAALFDQLRNRLRAGGDDRHFDPGADFLDRLVGLLALDGVVLGVDGVQAALVTRAEDVLEDDVADRILTVGSADDGNRFRFEKPSEIVLFQHGEPLVRLLLCSAEFWHNDPLKSLSE
jgi:hypothetical protein